MSPRPTRRRLVRLLLVALGGAVLGALAYVLGVEAPYSPSGYYLPYRLHYTPEQFRRAYPMAPEFLELKRRVDPEELFQSRFYDHIRTH